MFINLALVALALHSTASLATPSHTQPHTRHHVPGHHGHHKGTSTKGTYGSPPLSTPGAKPPQTWPGVKPPTKNPPVTKPPVTNPGGKVAVVNSHAAASPAYKEWKSSVPQGYVRGVSPRPTVNKNTMGSPVVPVSSPPRTKTCYVATNGDLQTDDTPAIIAAARSCNNGGTVVFPKDQAYYVATALDLSFLQAVDLDIQGYIQFADNVQYWQKAAFNLVYQDASSFSLIGGADVNVFGGGMLDGYGQAYYEGFTKDAFLKRPAIFGTLGLNGGLFSDLRLRNAPSYAIFVSGTKNVVFQNFDITAASSTSTPAKNTDGWDTYKSSNIVIQDSVILNNDDCVAFKPASTDMLIQNLKCTGSHGISVGSLGQFTTEVDIVENLYVYNIEMTDASNGARVKVWPDAPSAVSTNLQGGGGSGRVHNVTFDTFKVSNVDYALEVTQCYGQKDMTVCMAHPSKVTISDITFKNIQGTTSPRFSPLSGLLRCSSPTVCSGIKVQNVNVKAPSGDVNLFSCGDMDAALLQGIKCSALYKGPA